MTTSSRTLLPTFVDQPIFPVPPGSVLSQLLESTNISSSRRPGMMTGTENSEKFQKSKSFCASKKSKIPTMKSAQGSDFEKSLRYYSVPGTPVSCMSRDPSPNTRCSSSRGTSPASRWGTREGSSLSSPRSRVDNNQGQGRSRPPPSPKSAPAKPIGPHQRPVRLAYGIHGAQYQQNQQKTPENPSPFYRQKETHSGCGSTFSGERTSRRLFSRMLPNHVVPKIERNLIPPCTPTQTEDGFILCPCQHVEIACQTISSELLSIHKKKKREEEDKDRKSVAEEEQQTDFEEANNECMICADTKKRLSKQDAKCQKLQGTVNELKKALEDMSFRNEMLELQLFENKEKFLEIEIQKREASCSSHHVVTSASVKVGTDIVTTDAGVATDEDVLWKFQLDDFFLSQLNSKSDDKTGAPQQKGDVSGRQSVEVGNDPIREIKKKMRTPLSARNVMFNEIRTKLKSDYPEVDTGQPLSPLAAAKIWLERTPSPLTTMVLNPVSFTNLFDPLPSPYGSKTCQNTNPEGQETLTPIDFAPFSSPVSNTHQDLQNAEIQEACPDFTPITEISSTNLITFPSSKFQFLDENENENLLDSDEAPKFVNLFQAELPFSTCSSSLNNEFANNF